MNRRVDVMVSTLLVVAALSFIAAIFLAVAIGGGNATPAFAFSCFVMLWAVFLEVYSHRD